ncbi:hypothetical protein B0H14DRAFT_2578114 [Mycena olivaceomarginata]|nr:hypothetical protein B0H14DRAFT_2578114 [Mycena olivaceomarginata]
MPPSATFFDIPLSSTFCADHEKSLLSLDWVLASGIKSSGSVASGVLSLPCEGSTCVINVPPILVPAQSHRPAVAPHPLMPYTLICLNLLTHLYISSVISLLPVTAPMPVSLQALIHHLGTGACADHIADVDSSSRLDQSTCRAVAQDFDSAASIRLYGKLTEGTLFSAQVSLSTYINKDYNPRFMDSKVYHVNVEKLAILDKGDGAPWNPPSPDLPSVAPSTPSKRARDPAVDSAFDDLSPF